MSRDPSRRIEKDGKLDPLEIFDEFFWGDSASKKCQICQKYISVDAARCPNGCGAVFHYEHLKEWVDENGTCPSCGEQITQIFEITDPQTQRLCPQCGRIMVERLRKGTNRELYWVCRGYSKCRYIERSARNISSHTTLVIDSPSQKMKSYSTSVGLIVIVIILTLILTVVIIRSLTF